jgi:hypothetical protein
MSFLQKFTSQMRSTDKVLLLLLSCKHDQQSVPIKFCGPKKVSCQPGARFGAFLAWQFTNKRRKTHRNVKLFHPMSHDSRKMSATKNQREQPESWLDFWIAICEPLSPWFWYRELKKSEEKSGETYYEMDGSAECDDE